MYADFAFYKNEFKGIQIEDEAVFDSAEVKAEAFINTLTYGRISEDSIPRGVQMAACAVAEIMDGGEAQLRGISSENNDGYSVSYAAGTEEAATYRRAYDTARFYLPSELLYAGVE